MNTRRRLAVAAVVLAALTPLTACVRPDTYGTVTARIHHGKWRYLTVREADGQTVKFRVGLLSHEWRHCHIGDTYPHCGMSAKKKGNDR